MRYFVVVLYKKAKDRQICAKGQEQHNVIINKMRRYNTIYFPHFDSTFSRNILVAI